MDMIHEPQALPFGPDPIPTRPLIGGTDTDTVIIYGELAQGTPYSGKSIYWQGPASQIQRIRSRVARFVAEKLVAGKDFSYGPFSGEMVKGS